jgi:hypothetical protein
VTSREQLYAPFRPRRARRVALALGVLSLVVLGVAAALLPQVVGVANGYIDQLAMAGLGIAIAWFCYRQASVSAVPDDDGLTVRNLFITTRVEWAAIVSVRFGQGRPWVQLDLADGDTLAVMGVQSSDGPFATAESRRLATLVALHEGRQ